MLILDPIQGTQFATVLQIYNRGTPPTPAVGIFDSTYVLSAAVWEGQNQTVLFAPTVSWYQGTTANPQTGYDQGQVLTQFAPAQTTGLDPAGEYFLQVYVTDSSTITSPVVMCRVKIIASPGNKAPVPLDLITYDYAEAAMSVLNLTDGERDYLPYAVAAASGMIRRYCVRFFNRQVYTKVYTPSIEGIIRLDEIPVNGVLRVSSKLDAAVQISGSQDLFQIAYVNYSTTGDWYSTSTPFTYTGVNLVSVNNGVQTSTPFLFSQYPTIGVLSNAINTIQGWTSQVTLGGPTSYSLWPSTEIYCEDGSQGALTGRGVQLRVFSQDISPKVDHRTGMVYIGYGGDTGGLGPSWGPEWAAFDFPGIPTTSPNVCRVIYDAGWDTVPPAVQQATSEVVKCILERMRADYLLKSESIGAYNYTLRDIWDALPHAVRQVLSVYRISNA